MPLCRASRDHEVFASRGAAIAGQCAIWPKIGRRAHLRAFGHRRAAGRSSLVDGPTNTSTQPAPAGPKTPAAGARNAAPHRLRLRRLSVDSRHGGSLRCRGCRALDDGSAGRPVHGGPFGRDGAPAALLHSEGESLHSQVVSCSGDRSGKQAAGFAHGHVVSGHTQEGVVGWTFDTDRQST
jgi:hypothetical protein